MGINIAGLVIDNNFNKDISRLEKALNWRIQITEEIDFGQASANWTPEGEIRVFFSDKANVFVKIVIDY